MGKWFKRKEEVKEIHKSTEEGEGRSRGTGQGQKGENRRRGQPRGRPRGPKGGNMPPDSREGEKYPTHWGGEVAIAVRHKFRVVLLRKNLWGRRSDPCSGVKE